jgi:hypothetical protein
MPNLNEQFDQKGYELERSKIAAEAAGIVLGRIMRLLIIVAGLFGLVCAIAISISEPAKSQPVEQAQKPIKIKSHKAKKVVDKASDPVINVYIENTERFLNDKAIV